MTIAHGTIVVGGGFAGIAAATALAERGERVTLVEFRHFLGGKAYSFHDQAAGHALDNGQHAFLRGYRNTLALLERWGAADLIAFQPQLDFTFLGTAGTMPFRCAPLPAPLHLLVPLLQFKALSWKDRLAMAMPALSLLATPPDRRRALDGERFGDWLRRHGQSARAIAGFWEPLALAAVNGSVERISTYPALQVLAAGFLTNQEASRFGYARRGLSALYEGFPAYFERHGGRLALGKRALALEPGAEARWQLRFAGDETLSAERLILAVPPPQLAKLLPPAWLAQAPFREAVKLDTAPIVSVQLTFDRKLLDQPVVALLESPIHWIFNGAAIRDDVPAGALSLVMSGAIDWIRIPNDQIQAMALRELERWCPQISQATLVACRVIKEPDATIDCLPDSDALRAGALTPQPGLFLAGAWTATGFPSTIEGAVISGLRAVEALEAERGRPCSLVKPIEVPDGLAALLARGLQAVTGARR